MTPPRALTERRFGASTAPGEGGIIAPGVASPPPRWLRRAPAALAGVVAGVASVLGRIGPAQANGSHVHIGGLSSGQSWLVIGAGAVVAVGFVAVFVVAWSRSRERGGPDGPDEPGEDSDAVRE